jgi:parallel beta-helix repeat protein
VAELPKKEGYVASSEGSARRHILTRLSRRVVATILGVLSLLVLAHSPAAHASRLYYVAANGNDSNHGTEARPFRTLRKGVSVLTPGAILYVKGGTYAEALINAIPGGRSWSQPVTVAAYPGHKVLVKPPRGSKFALHFQGAHQAYIVISGLTIDASNVTYEAVTITGRGTPATAAHHIRLVDSEIKNSPIAGVFTSHFAHSNEFIRLSVHGHGRVHADGTRKGHGFYLASDNNLVEQCFVHDNVYYGVLVSKEGGLVHGNVVRNNAITRNWGGSVLRRGSRNLFYNNLVYQNDTMGLKVGDLADAADVLNNTVYRNGSFGIYIAIRSTGAEVVNNIVHANTTDIRNAGRSTTLSRNITGDPKFVDAGRFDFRLRNNSPAIDGGVRIAFVTKDAAGTSRPQGLTHDVGAFEAAFAPSAAVKPAPTPSSPAAVKPGPALAPPVAPKPAPVPASAPTAKPAPTAAPKPNQTPTSDPAATLRADIVPSALKLGSATVKAGATTALQLTVANGGRATAKSVAVTISLVSGAGTSKAASISVGTLSAGASGTVATTLTAPMLTGTYTVRATAATPDPETSTENNTTSTTLGVSSASAKAGSSCDYYASPTGTGSGASSSAPFRVTDFWAVAGPGKTLCLLDGTYRGADSMITPGTRGGSGSSGKPITIKALNDGQVLFDGQFARVPVELSSNDWWVLEGFNAKNGSNGAVRIRGSNNVVRRVVAWDNSFASGGTMFSCQSSGTNNLFEDVAAFGIATWQFSHSQNKTGSCTFRRAWGRFEGTAQGQNGGTVFGGLFYNAFQSTCENCMAEYWANGAPASYPVTNATPTSEGGCPNGRCTDGAPPIPNGTSNTNRWDGSTSNDYDGQVLGSLFYVRAGANLARMTTGSGENISGGALLFVPHGRQGGDMTYKDVLWFVDPTHTQFDHIRGLNLRDRVNSKDSRLTNVSTVAGAVNKIDTEYWNVTNLVHASSLPELKAARANPWTGTAGANLCFRYEDRAKTSTPLWPWPMNERIKAATAAAGSYSGPCPGCEGKFPVRTAIDVTADIEKLLGTIPASCRQ